MNTRVEDMGPVARSRPLAKAVYGLDAYLCKRQGIFEYSHAFDCVFRAHIEAIEDDVCLGDGTALARGDRLVSLHIWNARFPGFPAGGPTMGWARQVKHRISFSLGELVRYLAAHPELADIRAVRGNMALSRPEQKISLIRMALRFGFEVVPEAHPPSWPSRLHRLGGNVLIALFQLAGNPASLCRHDLGKGRIQILQSRTELERRYGARVTVP